MFFNDFEVGQRFQTGSRTVTEDEIIAFARQWDPQGFHTDPEAAEKSFFGGLIASGFHTVLIAFNLVLEADIWTEASQGSPGIEDLKWIKPVRPGDTLRVEMEVIAIKPSSTRPDRGYVTWDYHVLNQDDVEVASWRSALIAMRSEATARS